jgi:hypothetical protein
MNDYRKRITALIAGLPGPLSIDPNIHVEYNPPTAASSELLINKDPAVWAERLVIEAINGQSEAYDAIPFGESTDKAAGDEGFEKFYSHYVDVLNK